MTPRFAGTVQTHFGGYELPRGNPSETTAALRHCLDEAVLLDREGFDAVLVPERHGRSECVAPQPLALLAGIAGLGAGFHPDYFRLFGASSQERLPRLERLVDLLRRAWAGELIDEDWDGRRLNGTVWPQPGREIPIWIGAQFPRSIRLAGHIADGWAIAFPFDRPTWDRHVARYREAPVPISYSVPPRTAPNNWSN